MCGGSSFEGIKSKFCLLGDSQTSPCVPLRCTGLGFMLPPFCVGPEATWCRPWKLLASGGSRQSSFFWGTPKPLLSPCHEQASGLYSFTEKRQKQIGKMGWASSCPDPKSLLGNHVPQLGFTTGEEKWGQAVGPTCHQQDSSAGVQPLQQLPDGGAFDLDKLTCLEHK